MSSVNAGARGMLRSAGLALLACLPALVVSVVLDRALGLFGYPAEWRPPVANPPNYRELRRNREFRFTFETNSHGLRYRELPLAKAPGERRILLLGDSFAGGEGVEYADTFGAILEQRFSRPGMPVNVINAGLVGAEPIDYGRILFNVGFGYHPDGVLMMIYANDLSNIPEDASVASLDPPSSNGRSGAVVQWLWPHLYAAARKARFRWAWRRERTTDFIGTVEGEARGRGIARKRIEHWRHALPPEQVQQVNRGEVNGALLSYGLLDPDYWTDALDIARPGAERRWRAMSQVLDEIVLRARRRGIPVAPRQHFNTILPMHVVLPDRPAPFRGSRFGRRGVRSRLRWSSGSHGGAPG